MVIVYNAANSIDANMIKGLLKQYKIRAFIQGEYLQGGIGELPTAGLVTVSVDNEHQAEARKIIDEWEAASVSEEVPNPTLAGGALNVTS
jgi:Putative prokaryotic signal transducing protein